MTELKFIDVTVVAYEPHNSYYEFAIMNQSHTNSNFGDFGNNFWTHAGFELKSISYPAAEYKHDVLFVRGDYSDKDNNYMHLKPPQHADVSTLDRINTWFIKMMNAIEAYNLYYSNVKRINILHK